MGTKFLGIETIAANALINEIENNGKDFVKLDKVLKYSQNVTENLIKQGFKVVVMQDGDRYKEYENIYSVDAEKGLIIKNEGVSVELLRDWFRGPLSYETLKACVEVEKQLNEMDGQN